MEYDITTLVANILIGIGLGIGLVAWWVYRTFKKFENQMRGLVQDTMQEVEAHIIGVIVEEHADQLYFYRDTDRQFLCQGTGLAEVRKQFNDMYPNKIAYLSGGDPALVERLTNELKNIKKEETNENSVGI